jgi:hypothetical protein
MYLKKSILKFQQASLRKIGNKEHGTILPNVLKLPRLSNPVSKCINKYTFWEIKIRNIYTFMEINSVEIEK